MGRCPAWDDPSAATARTPIFLGCEGESERSYGGLLQILRDKIRPDLHIVTRVLRGGDPLAVVEAAGWELQRLEKQHDISYRVRAVLLDSDKLSQNKARDGQITPIAQRFKFNLIWQSPCHEALLLRHVQGCQSLRPPTAADAITELKRRWPNYTKNSPTSWLAQNLELAQVRAAAEVEHDLAQFLRDIGLL